MKRTAKGFRAAALAALTAAAFAAQAEYSSLRWNVKDSNMAFDYAAVAAFGAGGYTAYLMADQQEGEFKNVNYASADDTKRALDLGEAEASRSWFVTKDADGHLVDLASNDYTFRVALFDYADDGFKLTALSNDSYAFSGLESLFAVTTPPNATGDGIWTVSSFYAVPEPTSGLLLLLGLAGLALKRRRS